ncbi:hypothetical protein BY996DRAFT_6424447 [Phakopsora pachyrhizi]|nr:hypothetical protein BY996DRAFT_6424447 [Phakopsora pachyrhizi]
MVRPVLVAARTEAPLDRPLSDKPLFVLGPSSNKYLQVYPPTGSEKSLEEQHLDLPIEPVSDGSYSQVDGSADESVQTFCQSVHQSPDPQAQTPPQSKALDF